MKRWLLCLIVMLVSTCAFGQTEEQIAAKELAEEAQTGVFNYLSGQGEDAKIAARDAGDSADNMKDLCDDRIAELGYMPTALASAYSAACSSLTSAHAEYDDAASDFGADLWPYGYTGAYGTWHDGANLVTDGGILWMQGQYASATTKYTSAYAEFTSAAGTCGTCITAFDSCEENFSELADTFWGIFNDLMYY